MTPQESAERFSYLLAQRLRELAHDQGIGQVSLSKKSGVSQSQISRVFKHERAISVDQFKALSGALGTSATAVVREVEEHMGRSVPSLSVVVDSLPDESLLAADTSEEESEQ